MVLFEYPYFLVAMNYKNPCAIFCLGAIALLGLNAADRDSYFEALDPAQLRVHSDHSARQSLGHAQADANASAQPAAAGSGVGLLPLWNYSRTIGRSTYKGQIVGEDPGANTPATVPVVLIPVILNITQGTQGGTTYTFDPTAQDADCLGAGNTAFNLMQQSPLFEDSHFILNGADVGTTQYADANSRAQIWQVIQYYGVTNFHLYLSLTTGPPLTISVNAGPSGNRTAEIYSLKGTQCGSNSGSLNPHAKLGVVNINTVDASLQNYIAANGLNSSVFPLFVLYNAVMSEGSASSSSNCCVLGYHTALGTPGQTYGIAEFEGRNQTVFSGISDIAAASHEVNEWVNDPGANNPSPAWGNIGQVSGCQSDFEVGDPLSGTLLPAIEMPNGFTYHVQELAFFSWFYGGSSIGSGGMYSNNGTFKGPAKACPPGGTN